MKAQKLLRILTLLGVWGLITTITILHQIQGGGPTGPPTVDALCPFGGAATLYRAVAGGEYLTRTWPSSIILLSGTVLLALLFRRAFCGWLCPLGAMQELFSTIGRKLHWRRALHGNPVDRGLRWVKYLVLVVILAATWATGELVFRPYDPWASYAHITAGIEEIRTEFLVGTIVLIASLLVSLVVDRPWCRYLCPLGALLGPISKLGAARIVRNTSTCINCRRCDAACPVDIEVQSMQQVTDAECLACGECVGVCPVSGTLQFKAGKRAVSPVAVGLAAVAIFFGVIFAAKAAGVWKSRADTMAEITAPGGALDAANIRGFMSLSEVSESYGVAAEDIIAKLGLPPDTDRQAALKDIMGGLGRDVEEARQAVAALLGRPTGPGPAGGEKQGDGSGSPGADITGNDTLADVADRYGVPAETILEALKLPADTDRDRPLRDIMKPLGREVTEIREVMGELQGDKGSEE